ncbi:MAG: phosphoadenosine phosphosulfate reductase family protein [Culicoidibacterales bacterium]
MLTLELAVHDALHRIKEAYNKTNGKIYLSFSGGKDSTIVAELIKMAELPTKIPFVFADTGIELGATERFVKNYDYENIVYVKPEKRMQQIIKEYGVPAMSKVKSQHIGTWQRQVENGIDPTTKVACTRLLGTSGNGADKLANKHLHFLHPEHEYKVANQCCNYMKKKPFAKFEAETEYKDTFTGVRIAEGGIRATQYKSCVIMRKKGKREQLVSMPIIDWSDEICDEFIAKYNVKLSDAYEVYGFTRTGCIGCSFSNELEATLPVPQKHEPLKYKATMHFFKMVYVDLDIKLPDDEQYLALYNQRRPVVEARRLELLRKYRPEAKELKKHE